MLFPMADLGMPLGPPPQGILDKKWLWNVLLILLCLCFILRFIGLDIPGALLSGLMLCFVVMMTRDGMQEMLRYALVFAVLCFLNFFFDLLPLMTELGGRVRSRTMPVASRHAMGGAVQTEYKMVVTSRPFFDFDEGIVYNVQSLAMILSPITMALGCYLAVSAYLEGQRFMHDPLFDDGFRDDGLGLLPRPQGAINQGMMQRGSVPGGQMAFQDPSAPEDRPLPAAAAPPPARHFQGKAYKLGSGPVSNN